MALSPRKRRIRKNEAVDYLIAPSAIILYWVPTLSAMPFFYGLDWLSYEIFADNLNSAHFYLMCSTFPAVSLTFLLRFNRVKSLTVNLLVFMLLFLAIENIVMMLDAAFVLDESPRLYAFDDFIQGDPDSRFPYGASDIILAAIGGKCLMNYYTLSRGWR